MANKLAPQNKPAVPQRTLVQRMKPQNLMGQKSETSQKNAAPQKNVAAVKPESRPVKFVRDLRSELRKVAWPTRETAINLTVLVVAVSAGVGIVIGAVDLVWEQLFKLIFNAG